MRGNRCLNTAFPPQVGVTWEFVGETLKSVASNKELSEIKKKKN